MRKRPKKRMSRCLVRSEPDVDCFRSNRNTQAKRKREPADIDGKVMGCVQVFLPGIIFHTGSSLSDSQEKECAQPKRRKIQPTKRVPPLTAQRDTGGTPGDKMNAGQGPMASDIANWSAFQSCLPHIAAVLIFDESVLKANSPLTTAHTSRPESKIPPGAVKHKRGGVPVVPVRHQQARRCKN